MKQMERRRVTIKKAFFKFINEAFADDIPAKLNTTVMSHEENSEAGVLMEELVKSHGYKAESHAVVTTDDYVLIVHRILPPTLNESATKSGIVLLHHGLFGSSEDWVLLGPKKSLPYLLVNAHYDVWLTNARGNKYSKAHMSRTMTDDEFWNFSWHEIGQFDLSAVIDYIPNGGREIANKTLRQNILNRVPAGGSMKTIIHYIQLVKSGQFQMFDMGRSQNLKKYSEFVI
ncbi:lipase 3-like [Ostrinia furnacalis]|uniref:lipase 3-like n=1 Tax=Ostrinia furnacalis TaxID=93504 RepID=UPI00103ECE9B|nr:lipase 3-like [Ostrinia furnacalis]